MTDAIPLNLTRKDFVSDQNVRWCPGCGDYAILASVQKTLPNIGVPKENIVFISGIGCSSRFPYYMKTYGIHSIHGRAPTIASGLAISNPELSVWVVTGDGDGLSIGGNHLIHTIRRNIDINILLFNNRIYGLTKGQYSPTSRQGTKTKSSPMGSLEQPLNPIALAMAAEATFIARSIDAHTKHLGNILAEAAQHKGTSFVEMYQNCVIFNSKAWEGLNDRRVRDENILYLEHGQPMIFGKDRDKGVRLVGFQPEVVHLGNGIGEEDLLVHDETSTSLAFILASMEYPDFPAPMGVIRRVQKQTYTEGLMAQVEAAQAANGVGDLRTLYESADLWTVTAQEKPPVKSKQTGFLSLGVDEEYVDDIDQEPVPTTELQDMLTGDAISKLKPSAPITIGTSASLSKVIFQMNTHNIGCLLVTNSRNQMVGIFTEKDLLHRVVGLVDDLDTAVVADYMTLEPFALTADLPIAQALHEMHVQGFSHLPLVDDQYRPEGIISFRDVVRHLKETLA
ncbi:MAG: CBS domain-containing protein [Chloroflexi bacterium]|nr:CBS domain-containing protein [Chloroflexota bacterium]